MHLAAQTSHPPLPAPVQQDSTSTNPDVKVRALHPDAPDVDHVHVESVTQDAEGPIRHLRGAVRLETSDLLLRADELDYNTETGDAQARGHEGLHAAQNALGRSRPAGRMARLRQHPHAAARQFRHPRFPD